jgi:NodT family efflux transporter outer membrane factor (OMF) lipoprotein
MFLVLAPAALLAGCMVGPNYSHPALLPQRATKLDEADIPGINASPLPARWWRLFDDPDLDRLVARALVHNTDLRQAAANLQRARAALSEAHAARLPTGEATAEYQHERTGGALSNGAKATGTDFFALGYDASYEIDLFGGVSRSIEAARADVESARAEVDAARVSVAAETARTYAGACSFADRLAVARETVELQARSLELTERLYRGGRSSERDLMQARALFEETRAQVPALEAERRAALYALAVLTGDPPAQVDAAAAQCRAAPAVKQPIPVGDGQALLSRRPDVRGAERALAASVARIGVATAQLYPSIRLLGLVSLGAPSVSDLGKSQSFGFSLGPLISWSFPNGGARARVREAEAKANGSLAAFDGTVLHALQETDQALARLGGAVEREKALANAATASERAAELTRIRYRAGSDSFLALLVAERDRAVARAALAEARADRADAQVSLFKALGGGWEEAPDVEVRSVQSSSDRGGRRGRQAAQ